MQSRGTRAHRWRGHRKDLRAAGLSRHDVASEVAGGRWSRAGRNTVVIGTGAPSGEAELWRAVWETGGGAVIDGTAALIAAGLTGFRAEVIDVSLPTDNRRHPVAGVRRCRAPDWVCPWHRRQLAGARHGCRPPA